MTAGPWQIILIVVVILLLFGARRIPELMGSLGKGIKEFKKATDGSEATAETKNLDEKKDQKES